MVIISGGQSGVDRAALDVALERGISCGGWCPEGRLAEDGPIAADYPLKELKGGNYVARTYKNVADSDATVLIYFGELEGGTKATEEFCQAENKPCLTIDATAEPIAEATSALLSFVRLHRVEVLNVAGPRATKQPESYAYTKALLTHYLDRV